MDPGSELVDVVDEDDRVVATVPRREMRARRLLHRCTYVLLRNAAGDILVHRRTHTKDVFPGAYDVFAGGVCAAGESYDVCARRELAEELGVTGVEPAFLFRHRYRGPTGQAWGAVYEARWDGPIRHQETEVAWSAWVTPAKLRGMLAELEFCPDSREIFARLGGSPDHAGVAFRPPLLLLGSLGAGFLLRRLAPVTAFASPASSVVGPAIVALAFALFLWAVLRMLRGHASIPTHTPTDAIVTGGPFRFTRNPIYLSMVLLQLGAGVWARSPWFFVLAAVSVALLTWGVIVREERYLARKFGGTYLSYQARVRRWI